MTIDQYAALVIGAVIGLIGVSIFAVVLWKYDLGAEMVRELKALAALLLGGPIAGYVVFQYITNTPGLLAYYMLGLGGVFLGFGLLIFVAWLIIKMTR